MRYSKYPSYRDSGVVWMKEVPIEWTSIKFKQVLLHKQKTTNHTLNCGSISFGSVVYKDNDKIPEETRAAYQEVLAGEFLINPLNLNFDLKSLRTALSTLDVVVSTGYIVLQSKPNINKNYLRWLLYQFDVAHMKTLGAGVRQTVNYTDIGNEYFFMPPLQEQQTIANYLDTATAKIDTLIEKQTKLIELLKEKRQAVISTAVTRGLDSTVAMKDSGVEWLGEIPEHWEIGLLSSLFISNKKKNSDLSNKNLLSLSYGRIIRKNINASKGLLPENFNTYQIVEEGYIILRLTDLQNDKKSLRTGYVKESGIITSAYIGLAKKSASIGNEKYFHLYLHTFDIFKGFYGMGAGVRQGLNFDEFKKLKFTLPPHEEQNKIVDYIERKTNQIDELLAKSTKAIDLLKEKRTALISAAVTGKIDVREEN